MRFKNGNCMEFHKEILNKRICANAETTDKGARTYFNLLRVACFNTAMLEQAINYGFVINPTFSEYRHRYCLTVEYNDYFDLELIKSLISDEQRFHRSLDLLVDGLWSALSRCRSSTEAAIVFSSVLDLFSVYKYKHGTEGIINVH